MASQLFLVAAIVLIGVTLSHSQETSIKQMSSSHDRVESYPASKPACTCPPSVSRTTPAARTNNEDRKWETPSTYPVNDHRFYVPRANAASGFSGQYAPWANAASGVGYLSPRTNGVYRDSASRPIYSDIRYDGSYIPSTHRSVGESNYYSPRTTTTNTDRGYDNQGPYEFGASAGAGPDYGYAGTYRAGPGLGPNGKKNFVYITKTDP